MIKTYGIAYLTTAVVFLCIDAVWLTVMASRLYKPLLGPMLLDTFDVTKASALPSECRRRSSVSARGT